VCNGLTIIVWLVLWAHWREIYIVVEKYKTTGPFTDLQNIELLPTCIVI